MKETRTNVRNRGNHLSVVPFTPLSDLTSSARRELTERLEPQHLVAVIFCEYYLETDDHEEKCPKCLANARCDTIGDIWERAMDALNAYRNLRDGIPPAEPIPHPRPIGFSE